MQLNLPAARPGTRAELFASVGRYWNLWNGLGVRAQAIAGAQVPGALTLTAENGCAECEVRASRQFAGVTTALTYEWRQRKAFRPYVVGGGGVVFTHASQRLEGPCVSTNSCTYVDPWEARLGSQARLGYTAGTGVAFRVRKTDMFAEYALHAVSRYATPLALLSTGLRF